MIISKKMSVFIVQPAPQSRAHHRLIIRLSAGGSAPCVKDWLVLSYGKPFLSHWMKQSGHPRFAFVALLLLALPDVLTFQTLFAFERLAERRRQF